MSNLSRRLTFASALAAFGVSMPSIVDSLPKHPKPVYGRMVHSGGTFDAGRNAEKRKARIDVKRVRGVMVRHHAKLATLGRAPKRDNLSTVRMAMLADRRLRQVGSRG